MVKTPLYCRQDNKRSWQSIVIWVAALTSVAIVLFWVVSLADKNRVVAFMGAFYALLCTTFLIAQLFAFVRAHFDYQETVEKPKFELLDLEESEWRTV